MTPQLLNEAFSAKITIIIYKRVFHVAVNTYVPIFRGLDARGFRKLRTDTHTHARGTTTVMIIIKIIRSAEVHAYNYNNYTYAKPLNIKHMH